MWKYFRIALEASVHYHWKNGNNDEADDDDDDRMVMVMMMMMMMMKAGCFIAAFEVSKMQMWSLHEAPQVPPSVLMKMKRSTLINGDNGE